jgi:hypothetical protein
MYFFPLLPPADLLATFSCALHRRQQVTTSGPVYQNVVIIRHFLDEADECQGRSLSRNLIDCHLAHM